MNPTPPPVGHPRGWLLFILIPALIAGAVFMVIQAVRTGPAGDVDQDLVASDADGEWRIDGTYRRATQYLEDFIW